MIRPCVHSEPVAVKKSPKEKGAGAQEARLARDTEMHHETAGFFVGASSRR
jgi:hypothetical protein